MKRGSTIFLRLAVLGIGAVVLALCIFALPALWAAVPAQYTLIPYVIYGVFVAMYAAAVPFFIALYQGLVLLDYIDNGKAFSLLAAKALKRIAYCAAAVSAIYIVAAPLFYIWARVEDAPGLMVIGLFFVGVPLIIAVFTALLQRLLKEAIAIKSENDLTV